MAVRGGGSQRRQIRPARAGDGPGTLAGPGAEPGESPAAGPPRGPGRLAGRSLTRTPGVFTGLFRQERGEFIIKPTSPRISRENSQTSFYGI
ncbi:MAG: hypothetical protein ACLQK8_28485 [Streptosporangiaceae bacterium]|jgi:hypothetical protein